VVVVVVVVVVARGFLTQRKLPTVESNFSYQKFMRGNCIAFGRSPIRRQIQALLTFRVVALVGIDTVMAMKNAFVVV
jgi:hypothetical protein